MLSVTQLTCQRGERVLFEGLNFELPEGQWLHVSGANGCGKTSLLRILTGLAEPVSGTISWNGAAIGEEREVFHEDLLHLGHQGALKEELTPLENLTLSLGMEGYTRAPKDVVEALHQFGLRGREHLPVRFLSAGQRRRVLLTRLLLRPARLWILDEPFTALDVHAVAFLTEKISAHLETQGTVVLTSHQPLTLAHGQAITL